MMDVPEHADRLSRIRDDFAENGVPEPYDERDHTPTPNYALAVILTIWVALICFAVGYAVWRVMG